METEQNIVELQQEIQYNSQQVAEFAETDMDFFAALTAPDVFTDTFPEFFLAVWFVLTNSLKQSNNHFDRFAIGFPRGHGKTAVIKLLILFAILFTNRRYILVIGANLNKAKAIIADVADFLDSPNIQTIFGNWRYSIEQDTQELKKFNFNGRSVILEAVGQGTAIRGSNQKNTRPDVMIFDDAQTKECAESIVEAEKFHSWMLGTALKAASDKGCTTIYIGNMYKDMEVKPNSGIYTCMLRNLQRSSSWTSFIVGAILDDMTALWPERHSLEKLLEEYKIDMEMGYAEIFYAEVLNCPNHEHSFYINTDKINKYTPVPGELHQGGYIVIDPATSKATPDQIVIGYFEIYDYIPVAIEILSGKYTSPETVHIAIDLALKYNCSLICAEATAYQYALCEWFEFALNQLGIIGITAHPIYNTHKSKNGRILKLFQKLMKHEMYLHPNVFPQVVHQALAFNPAKNNNVDDILDTLAMAEMPAVELRHLMVIPGMLDSDLTLLSNYKSQSVSPAPSSF